MSIRRDDNPLRFPFSGEREGNAVLNLNSEIDVRNLIAQELRKQDRISSKDPFIKAGKLTSKAIKEGTAENIKATEQAIAQLQDQFGVTQGFLDPFMQSGLAALQAQPESMPMETVNALDARLNQIMGSDAFSGLVEERMRGIENMLGVGGLTRSGAALREGAALPTDVAFDLENLIFNRAQDQNRFDIMRNQADIDRGFGAATNLAGFNTNLAEQIAALTGQRGAISQAGITGSAEALANSMMASAQQSAINKNAKRSSRNSLFGAAIGGALAGAFSDPLLKKNVTPIAKVGPLTLFEWDWRDFTKGTLVEHFPKIGFLSTQVREHFPDFVSEFAGLDVVNYPALMEELGYGS